MITPPIPSDEAQRLESLRRLLILDTPPEERFDRIVQFASKEFDVPIAAVCFVDSSRLWVKSEVGLVAKELPRQLSFCAYTIGSSEALIVENTVTDAKFCLHPMVHRGLRIKFYAGVPLILNDGARVGTLCLLDHKPRVMDELDVALLSSLRDLVVQELEAS